MADIKINGSMRCCRLGMVKSLIDPVSLSNKKFIAGNAKVVTKMSAIIHGEGCAGCRITGKK